MEVQNMIKTVRKLLGIFSPKKKIKPTMSSEEFEMLKKQFMTVRSRFSSTEEKDVNIQLQSLTTEMPTMQRVLDFISLLVYALETEEDKSPEWLARLNELLKGADLSTLIKEFNANHFMMMVAINENRADYLQTRLHYVAIEIANRLGGIDFVLELDATLQREMKTK